MSAYGMTHEIAENITSILTNNRNKEIANNTTNEIANNITNIQINHITFEIANKIVDFLANNIAFHFADFGAKAIKSLNRNFWECFSPFLEPRTRSF